jgi:hypothetical protein
MAVSLAPRVPGGARLAWADGGAGALATIQSESPCTSVGGTVYVKNCEVGADQFPFAVKWCYKGGAVYGPLFKSLAVTQSEGDIAVIRTLSVKLQSENSCGWSTDQDFGTSVDVFLPLVLSGANWVGGITGHRVELTGANIADPIHCPS